MDDIGYLEWYESNKVRADIIFDSIFHTLKMNLDIPKSFNVEFVLDYEKMKYSVLRHIYITSLR